MPTYNQSAGWQSSDTWDMWVRDPEGRRGFEASIRGQRANTELLGKAGLQGALFCGGMPVQRMPAESGHTGSSVRENTLCTNPTGSGVKQVPGWLELSGQGLLPASSRTANTCRVSSCEGQLYLFSIYLDRGCQGCVYIPFMNSSCGLQLISLLYRVCIRF